MKFLPAKYSNYVSQFDQFSAKFDKTHAQSASQQAEIAKYQRINLLRDNPITESFVETEEL